MPPLRQTAPVSIPQKVLASDQWCHELARYRKNGIRLIPLPTGGNRKINVHIPWIYGTRNAVNSL
jgi:hypothetical protein